MRITIGKHFIFEASHQLPQEECYGKCSNVHGHRYELIVEITGKINSKGWICNFTEIKQIVNKCVIDKFDHNHLNNFFTIPTAENIALWIVKTLQDKFKDKPYSLNQVKLYETENSYALIECSN